MMKAVVTWTEEQLDPTTIAVRFHASGGDGDNYYEELEHAWQHFQARAYGVAAAPLPAIAPVLPETVDDEDRATQPPASRTRLLSLPEAFYVLVADAKWLAAPALFGSHEQIWWRFCSASAPDQRFQRHFIVQFHFRQLGWVLKSGLNYGAHYVLYRGAVNEFHSEYIVYVKQQPQEQLPWGVVQALTRVAADVKKTVLICDVACEELHPMGGAKRSVSDLTASTITTSSSTLTNGKYQFYDQEFYFTAVAMRFWDVSGSDSQAGGEQQQSFVFQSQPVLLKKKPYKKKGTGNIGKQARVDK